MEEAAFIKADTFKEVIAPTMGVKDTVTRYTQLLELKINGKCIFKVIKIGLSCNRCLRRMIECGHRGWKLPPWKKDRQSFVESLYGTSEADRRLMLRETHGITQTDSLFIFRPFLHKLREARAYTLTGNQKVDYVYVGIDPAGGGVGSDWAISSQIFIDAKFVVSSKTCIFFLFV